MPNEKSHVLRVFMDRDTWEIQIRDLVVQEPDQQPHQPALGLALFSQEKEVVPGNQPDVDLGNDGIFESDDAGKEVLAAAERPHEVVVDFAFDGLGDPAAFAELTEVGRLGGGGGHGVVGISWVRRNRRPPPPPLWRGRRST